MLHPIYPEASRWGRLNAPEGRCCDQDDTEGGQEHDGCENEKFIHAGHGNRTGSKIASHTGPPVSEQANVHQYVADHTGNERLGRPGKKAQQQACAKNDGNHGWRGPSLGEMQSHEKQRRN